MKINELTHAVNEFDLKHSNFFASINASTMSFIDVCEDKIVFKPGIVLNEKIWDEMKVVFGSDSQICEYTFSA